MKNKILYKLAFVSVGLLPIGQSAMAEEYPKKPIELIVPFGSGGALDSATRLLAEGLREKVGRPVIVKNTPGASGLVAANYFTRVEPDGYTLLIGTPNLLTFPKSVLPNRAFDPLKDFIPISFFYEAPLVFVVPAKSPFKSLGEFVRAAKERPGVLNYGSYGVATTTQFCMEELKRQTKIRVLHIPNKGGPMLDLLAGQVDIACETVPAAQAQVKAGTLRMLAIASADRARLIPDVPTAAQEGFPGLEVSTWGMVVARKGTSANIINRLNGLIRDVVNSAAYQARIENLGFKAHAISVKESEEIVRTDSVKWDSLVRESGIKVN